MTDMNPSPEIHSAANTTGCFLSTATLFLLEEEGWYRYENQLRRYTATERKKEKVNQKHTRAAS